jgi:hypothetical protein
VESYHVTCVSKGKLQIAESSAIAPCNPRVLLSFEEQFIVPKVKKKSIMIVITQRKTLLDFIINKGK